MELLTRPSVSMTRKRSMSSKVECWSAGAALDDGAPQSEFGTSTETPSSTFKIGLSGDSSCPGGTEATITPHVSSKESTGREPSNRDPRGGVSTQSPSQRIQWHAY